MRIKRVPTGVGKIKKGKEKEKARINKKEKRKKGKKIEKGIRRGKKKGKGEEPIARLNWIYSL